MSSSGSFAAVACHVLAVGLALVPVCARAEGELSVSPSVELSSAATAGHAGSGAQRMVFSMMADLSARTSLVFERSRLAPTAEPMRAALGGAPQTKLGFEFRPVSAANALRPVGALRVQMSDNSSLSFRPRRGGMLVSWRAKF